MSLARSKVVTVPRASAAIRSLANPPKDYEYLVAANTKGSDAKHGASPYHTERRAKTPGTYKPLQHDSRPTTPHDHHHPWKPHKSNVVDFPEYLLTQGQEDKHVDIVLGIKRVLHFFFYHVLVVLFQKVFNNVW